MWDLSALKHEHARIRQRHKQAVEASLAEAGGIAQRHVKRTSAFKARSGGRSLKNTIRFRTATIAGGKRLRIFSGKRHAPFLEFGTKAHGPVRAKFLRFRIGSRLIFTKRVRGIRATRFLRKATEAAFDALGPALDRRMRQAVR